VENIYGQGMVGSERLDGAEVRMGRGQSEERVNTGLKTQKVGGLQGVEEIMDLLSFRVGGIYFDGGEDVERVRRGSLFLILPHNKKELNI
jgi:hypothetical protein